MNQRLYESHIAVMQAICKNYAILTTHSIIDGKIRKNALNLAGNFQTWIASPALQS
jgi:hypothetical protein